MAILHVNDEIIKLEDEARIVEHIENAGVPIGCSNGVCGTCEVEVLDGMSNLNELTEEEEDLGMEGNKRLGCQCIINKGTVKLEY